MNNNFRIESDSFGEMRIPKDKHYGAQTARSQQNFDICTDGNGHKMPKEVIKAMLFLKQAATITNKDLLIQNPEDKNLKKLTPQIADNIIDATETILNRFDEFYENNFPLVVWQTGSGTQTNMNVNEVIASVANEKINKVKGGKSPVHPNDHCNLGQSSNDTFPTAMHIATTLSIYNKLFPTLFKLYDCLQEKEDQFKNIVKIGRTHTQDATPITLGQEFSGYKYQIFNNILRLNDTIDSILFLAQGGTAVGTGLNSHPEFANNFAHNISKLTGIEDIINNLAKKVSLYNDWESVVSQFKNRTKTFMSNHNKFESLASCDPLIQVSGVLNTIATSIMKIANDIRFLGSGPRIRTW